MSFIKVLPESWRREWARWRWICSRKRKEKRRPDFDALLYSPRLTGLFPDPSEKTRKPDNLSVKLVDQKFDRSEKWQQQHEMWNNQCWFWLKMQHAVDYTEYIRDLNKLNLTWWFGFRLKPSFANANVIILTCLKVIRK